MDPKTGNSWENDDGTISIVKTEIEDYDTTEQNDGDENLGVNSHEYDQTENNINVPFLPKREYFEPEVNYTEGEMALYQNPEFQTDFQQTSSSMEFPENWSMNQGFSIPMMDPHFMNQPGTSDISNLAFKREAQLYPCSHCDYVGAHPKLLSAHMNNKHIKSVIYQCPHCQYNSTIPKSTRDHIQSKHSNEDDEKPIIKRKCEFCDYCASNATSLKNHMNKHTKETKHQCSFCDFNTLWEGYLKMHIRRKHGEQCTEFGSAKEYPCQYCDYKAATPSTLKLHINKHTREQEHQCPYCPYKTVWTTYIKLHIKNKHFKGEKSPATKEHPCSFCDYKAKNTTLLRQHMNKHTRETVHQCPHCPFNTLWVTYMKLHIKRKHSENNENEVAEKKDFQCQYCPYKAISLSHLKIHENKHTKAIEYKCDKCDFKTTWYGYLKFHIKRKHEAKVKEEDEEKKSTYPCSFCPYKAINPSTLKVHMNKHTRENIYTCPHCEFKTTWRAYIKSHIQKHNADNFKTRKQGDASVRSFPCQFCSYVATQMGSLKLHINSKHTRENMHKCPDCDYQCAVYGNLRMHIRRKHSLKPDENGMYHCKQCDFLSENAAEIKTHSMEKHDMNIEIDDVKTEDEKMYSCQYCPYTTLYQQVMKKHINKHTRQNVIKCPHCPYSTVWNHYMKVHIKRHNEPKTLTGRQRSTKPNTDQSRLFPCQYCDHRSLSFSSLRDHINSVHTRAVIHTCPYCDHKCTLKGNLKGHIRRKHPAEYIEQEKRYQCEHCEFQTSERRLLKIHLKKEHNIDDAKVKAENGEYQCQYCAYKARSYYSLKIHLHKHTKENAYRCPQCEFATKWPNYLRKHIKQHSIGKSRVFCLYCDYKGCSTFRLRKHIEGLHKVGDYYPCPKPNCLFKTIHYTSLRMHLKGSIHASGVPRSHMSVSRNFTYKYERNEGRYFACDYCDYAAKCQSNLDRHIQNKHDKKGTKCGLCSYRGPSRNFLARHYKLRHSGVKKEETENIETSENTNTPKETDASHSEDTPIDVDDEDSKIETMRSENKMEEILDNSNASEHINSECEGEPTLLHRSKRKRSFIPYYAEESDDEDNVLICEDFLEVELGSHNGNNDKQKDVENNREQEENEVFEPKVEIEELETIENSCSLVKDMNVKIEEEDLSLENISNGNEPAERVKLISMNKKPLSRSKTNGISIPAKRKILIKGKSRIVKRMNEKKRIIVKKVVMKKNTSRITTKKSNLDIDNVVSDIKQEPIEDSVVEGVDFETIPSNVVEEIKIEPNQPMVNISEHPALEELHEGEIYQSENGSSEKDTNKTGYGLNTIKQEPDEPFVNICEHPSVTIFEQPTTNSLEHPAANISEYPAVNSSELPVICEQPTANGCEQSVSKINHDNENSCKSTTICGTDEVTANSVRTPSTNSDLTEEKNNYEIE